MVTSMTPNRVNKEQSASGNRKEEIFNLHTAAGKVEAGWVSVTQLKVSITDEFVVFLSSPIPLPFWRTQIREYDG